MIERKIEIVLQEHESKHGDAYDGFMVTLKAFEGGEIIKESQPEYMGLYYAGHPNFQDNIGQKVTEFVAEIGYPQFVFD